MSSAVLSCGETFVSRLWKLSQVASTKLKYHWDLRTVMMLCTGSWSHPFFNCCCFVSRTFKNSQKSCLALLLFLFHLKSPPAVNRQVASSHKRNINKYVNYMYGQTRRAFCKQEIKQYSSIQGTQKREILHLILSNIFH